jgi:glutamate dehydrogenase
VTSRSPESLAASDPDLAALTALYERHAPDLSGPLGGNGGELQIAARAHLALAEHRAAGEPVVRVENAPDGGLVVEIVTDDMPFLVAALLAAITRAGGEVRRVLHPIVVVRRAPNGKLADVLTRADPDAPPPDALAESWTRLELAPLAVAPRDLEAKLIRVLREVREIVADAGQVDLAMILERVSPLLEKRSAGLSAATVANHRSRRPEARASS